ncbi:hypothetical protein ACWDO7_21170 [Streptomyces sp. NPDC003656]
MYGHGEPPPARPTGAIITLRVLMVACGLLTCGTLACVPLFRAAFLSRKWVDWLLAPVSLVLSLVCFDIVGTVPYDDSRGDMALAGALLIGVASAVRFLFVDVYHYRNNRYGRAGYAPPYADTLAAPYSYAPPAPLPSTSLPPTLLPPTPQPEHPMPPLYPQHPLPHGTVPPQSPPPLPPPQTPAPARIDQVRAELDELSDYLRRHDRREGEQ